MVDWEHTNVCLAVAGICSKWNIHVCMYGGKKESKLLESVLSIGKSRN